MHRQIAVAGDAEKIAVIAELSGVLLIHISGYSQATKAATDTLFIPQCY